MYQFFLITAILFSLNSHALSQSTTESKLLKQLQKKRTACKNLLAILPITGMLIQVKSG